MSNDHDEHREGLEHDLPAMQQRGMVRRSAASPMARRGVLGLFGGVGAAALVGCGSDDSTTISSTSATSLERGGLGRPALGSTERPTRRRAAR